MTAQAALAVAPGPQPCALCHGDTEPRDILPGERSHYCPRCRVWTAASDGHEAERRQRYVDLATPIAVKLARARKTRMEATVRRDDPATDQAHISHEDPTLSADAAHVLNLARTSPGRPSRRPDSRPAAGR